MVNAVNRLPIDSATISVARSGVIDHSVGEVEVLGDDGGRVVGVDPHDDTALERLRPDVGAPEIVDHHVAEVRRHDVGQIGDGRDGFAVVPQHLAVLGGGDQQ